MRVSSRRVRRANAAATVCPCSEEFREGEPRTEAGRTGRGGRPERRPGGLKSPPCACAASGEPISERLALVCVHVDWSDTRLSAMELAMSQRVSCW